MCESYFQRNQGAGEPPLAPSKYGARLRAATRLCSLQATHTSAAPLLLLLLPAPLAFP